jgi:adenylylsulfate reductase subunit A
LARFEEFSPISSDPDINHNYIKPKMFMFRLQKIMDEYCAGVSAQFTTNKHLLERGLELLTMLKEDSEKLAAEDLHELMRCWENVQRMWIAESHLRHVMFREESRWPGYYYRADFPNMDEANWKVFVNSVWDPATGEWTMKKVPVVHLDV